MVEPQHLQLEEHRPILIHGAIQPQRHPLPEYPQAPILLRLQTAMDVLTQKRLLSQSERHYL